MNAFSKLPNLFDRNFAIGYFLPAFILLFGIYLALDAFGRAPPWLSFNNVQDFFDAAIVAAIAWLTAIGLLAINRPVVRLLEGYGGWNPFGLFASSANARFWGDAAPALRMQKEVDTARAQGRPDPETPKQHARMLWRAVEQFPQEQENILPTRFGNKYRAFEVYSRVVYGLDAVPAWGRLQALIPQDYQSRIAETKAQLDFSVNLMVAAFATAVVYLAIGLFGTGVPEELPSLWLLLACFLVLVFGYFTALSALSTYGLYVKSAFDLYRRELADKLGLELPRSPLAEREMWVEVSRMMIYRSPAALDRLTKFRKHTRV